VEKPPIHILIVDDEPRNLTVLETILDDPEYVLVRAESADEALLALVNEQFAVLILDIRMPGMTGFELAEVIKQRKKTAEVPIIFLTAYYSEDQHILEGYGSGAVDFLHKPVNPQILRSKVAVFAELYRKSRDVAMANRALSELNETLEQRVAARTEELRQANRLKDEFLAMLGHELRNPLAAITNAVQVINASGGDAARAARAMSLVDRQTRNLRRIVDDLLDVARVTRGRIDLRKQPVDVMQIIGQAVDVVRPQLNGSEEIKVELLADAPLCVDGDLTRLEQSIVNLLLNAIKYTLEGRQIKITVDRVAGESAQVDHEVVISISDNGIGIAPEVLPHVFDLFTQADRSLDRSQGGLGIGLFICRRLIELHGGSISASSNGLGRGATFSIRLPMIQMPDVADDGPPVAVDCARVAEGVATKRVLIVDDNVDSAVTLSWLLAEQGYSVHIAHDGAGGLQAAHDFKPDILLLDIGLPGINGYELGRRLRADGFASAYMVAITGYARDSDVASSHDAGFDCHFAKPVDLDNLIAKLSSC